MRIIVEMRQHNTINYQNSGFTLVEMLIALLISGIVIASVYSGFKSQQDSYLAQDQVAEIQQNIRVGVDMISREARMAGYDPTQSAGAGITVATISQFGFTQDLDEDGDVTTVPGETVTFRLNGDTNGDGIVDSGGVSTIGRRTGAGVFQPLTENIQAIEFYYTLANGTQTTTPATIGNVRSIQISILARAANPDKDFSNTKAYVTFSGAAWGPFNDGYRRRLMMFQVKCRNMGL